MRNHLLFLLISCSSPRSGPLPDPAVPANTLVFREHIASRGIERTGSWWGHFDGRGCYTEGHNTWLWVHDPVLQHSTARPLHFNTLPPGAPWFCLTERQTAKLISAARRVRVPPSEPPDLPPGPVDRWTVVVGGATATMVVPLGGDSSPFAPVIEAIAFLAREGVWGQSPEPGQTPTSDTSEPATAMLP